MMCLYEVVDREVVLPVVEARAATDDLLELDNGVDGPHQDDVADIAGVHTGGELLRGGQVLMVTQAGSLTWCSVRCLNAISVPLPAEIHSCQPVP